MFTKYVCNVAEEQTAGGRLFHALGSATANARSLIVDRHVAIVFVAVRTDTVAVNNHVNVHDQDTITIISFCHNFCII